MPGPLPQVVESLYDTRTSNIYHREPRSPNCRGSRLGIFATRRGASGPSQPSLRHRTRSALLHPPVRPVAPFHTKVITATRTRCHARARWIALPPVDLQIEEHYTDTAGFTDHVFAHCHLLGFRFAPRIRDLADRRLYVPDKGSTYPALGNLIGGTLSVRQMAAQWKEILLSAVR